MKLLLIQLLKNNKEMKKLCTILFVCGVATFTYAQNTVKATKNGALTVKLSPIVAIDNGSGVRAGAPAERYNKTAVETGEIIGYTRYDLQTNGTMSRRLLRYPDGKMSAVWTLSTAQDPTNDGNRGTAYNKNNGSGWDPVPDLQRKIEGAVRSGFTNIVTNASNHEIVITHSAPFNNPDNDFITLVTKNTGQGTAWKNTQPIANNNGVGKSIKVLWHKAAASGNNIYTIASPAAFTDTSNGMVDGVYFSRSTDGGTTFSNFTLLPGEDTINYPQGLGSADRYSIDAFDKYVVISAAGQYTDLAIWKSEDFGATFTRQVIEEFPIKNYTGGSTDVNNDGTADTLAGTNLSPSVILDKNGNTHLFWGRRLYYNDGTDTLTAQLVLSLNVIMHWDEANKVIKSIGGPVDTDKDGEIATGENFNFSNYTGVGLAGMTTTGIDAQGNIYVAFMAVVEGDETDPSAEEPGQNYHNIFATKTTDGGKTFCPQVNLTGSIGAENAFPSMARFVDDKMHIVWQRDFDPGTALQNQDPPNENEIVYAAWSVGSIADCTGFGTAGIRDIKTVKDVQVSAYPNPTSGAVNFSVVSAKNTTGTVVITDMLGKVVKVINTNGITVGNNTVNADLSSLSNGVYFYNVATKEGRTATEKLVLTR